MLGQFFGNLPRSAITDQLKPFRRAADSLGLYQRGWGMFAATNSYTTVSRTLLTYANGENIVVREVGFKATLRPSAWNEVQQDLIFEDNGDKERRILAGYLRYTCQEFDEPGKRLRMVAFQTRTATFPYQKDTASGTIAFTTKRSLSCP
jgi:hypothetical protein